MAVVDMAQVPEAFVEVTVSSNEVQYSMVGRRQRVLYKNAMQEKYRAMTLFGGFPIHTSDLLTRLDRGEEAWVPDLQSSDESEDDGPVKPTLKRLPKGGTWWDRYRTPATYPSSDSTNSGDDQEIEVEDEKPQHGNHRLRILHRNLLDISKGNGSNGLKQREAFRNGSQLKKPPRSQLGKLNSAETNDVGGNMTKEKAVGEEQQNHCFICNRTFKSIVSLSNHQRIHPDAKTYECSSCGKTFTVKKKFVQHLGRHEEGKISKGTSSTTKHQTVPSGNMPYKCLECKKFFMRKDHLIVHQRRHAAKRPYMCPECGRSYIRKEHLNRHQKIHKSLQMDKPPEDEKEAKVKRSEASEKKSSTVPVCKATISPESPLRHQENQTYRYICKFCGKCLRYKSLLVDHERFHREGRPHKCSQCKKSFHYKHLLLKHKTIHTKSALKLPKKRKTTNSLSGSRMQHKTESPSKGSTGRKVGSHSMARHSGKQMKRFLYPCQYCGKSLSRSFTLADHEKLHTGERPYKCHECGESFIRKHHLIRHQENHSGQAPFKHMKHVRKLRTKSRFAVLKKMNTGHGRGITHNLCLTRHPKILPEAKYYKCQYCGKCLKTKSALINHKKVHRGKKPYQCLECRKTFSQKNHLLSHQKSHMRKTLSVSSDSNQKTSKNNLPSSLKHGNPERRKLPYLCHNCGESFSNIYALKKHQNVHSGHKLFKCSTCGKCFGKTWNLKRHESTHLKEKPHKQPIVAELNCQRRIQLMPKPFKCAESGKDFVQTGHLKTHARTHLREKSQQQSIEAEVNHVFSNPGNGFSEEKDWRDPLVKDKPKIASRTEENSVLQDTEEEKMDPVLVIGERSKMGAMGDSEQGEAHVQMQAKLSKIPKENVLHNRREAEVPVNHNQVVKPEGKLRRENSATLHYKQDIHYIHQQLQPKECSKQTNSQTCKKENLSVDLQLRSQTMSRRKSERGMQLPSRGGRSCICQEERLEMTNRKKSPNAKICKKVKACNNPQRDSSATVFPRLLKNTPKSFKPERPCLSMPSHSTVSGISEMETTESIGRENSAGTEQQRGMQEVLGNKQKDSQSCGPDICESLDVSLQAESQALQLLPQSSVSQNCEKIQPTKALQNTAFQNQGELSIRQQSQLQLTPSGAAGKPQSHMEGKGCSESEPLKSTLCEAQGGAPKREIVTQHEPKEIQVEHVCTQCLKAFRSQENLLIHEKSHKGDNRPFLCTRCDEGFYAVHNLNVHMRSHTGEKPFKCSKCDFRCNMRSNLSRHKKTHIRERPFPCVKCGESFWFSHSLFVHLRIHSVKEPYRCHDCKQMFSRKNLLRLHRKHKHNAGGAVSACSNTE